VNAGSWNEAMRIMNDGKVGIGIASPTARLDVVNPVNEASLVARFFNDGNDVANQGIAIQIGTDDNSGTNYHITMKDGDGTDVGYVTSTSGTVSYGAFTANHDVQLPEEDNDEGYAYGTLVCTQEVFYKDSQQRGIEYKVKECDAPYARRVLGAYANKYSDKENLHQVYILGDGHILVNGENGNIEAGDAITTSSTTGIGMKAARAVLAVGVAQEDHLFTNSDEVYLMPVQYGLIYYRPE